MPVGGGLHGPLHDGVRPFIDLIDSMRQIGVEKELPLPAIAVIGDQSSGKSSVIEALSGVSLPRGTGIVTRCPLELKLRKTKSAGHWQAAISYKGQRVELKDPSQVEEHVKIAQNTLAGEGVGICDDLITLEIMAPDVCDLTLIDLPGIARVPVKGQPDDIDKQIRQLIVKYITKCETINLVVIACNVDIATTEALRMAQEVDPEGKRTLAILTKPDLIDKGTEKNVLGIIQNEVIPLNKGYIIVKCRGQAQINKGMSLADAMKEERDFFKHHTYFSSLLNEEKATIKCLSTKLTQDLVDHIKATLPLLSEQIKKELWTKRKELSKYENGPPLDPHKRKVFLIKVLTHFNQQINLLAHGELVTESNLLIELRTKFQEWKNKLDSSKPSFQKTTEETLKEYNQKYRGMELPGFCKYSTFEKVVQTFVIELKSTSTEILTDVNKTIEKQFKSVSESSFNNYPFLQNIVMNMIENIQSKQEAKVKERIYEQFEMEKLVYTQDDLYYKTLEVDVQRTSGDSDPILNSRKTYPEMLTAYYEIVVQRLADQVPMLIRYFMLKESAQLPCSEMLALMDGANVMEVLREESDSSKHCIDMQNRMDRLTIAQEKLSNFV
ncbi:interferon-induced GTP-binding protein Mx-like [Brachyhypopomus gauderio]|uniref:interferon-induced GTP-binding protein Mx-like n=1 Tax=Brachyhypopomus gauderio TaxID=698409 RepID=UPI0040434DF7